MKFIIKLMELLFQKDEKGFVIPIFKNEINEKSFNTFFKTLEVLSLEENIITLKKLKDLIIESPEIGQIFLDLDDIYKKRDNGLIEILIEKYLSEEISEEEENFLENFFIFISNPFQIKKNIYDFIYKKIGFMIRSPSKIQFDKKIVFNKCINLLKIFYDKKNVNYEVFKDIFFYLNNNEINTNISKDNTFSIGNFLEISFFIFINDNYQNLSSSIEKIIFSRTDELLIKLSDKIIIDILYNYNKVHSITLNLNQWNYFSIKIKPNQKKCEFSININNDNYNYTITKEINKIINLSFFSNFYGIVSPIIISEEEIKEIKYFSKTYIKELFLHQYIDKNDKLKIEEIDIRESISNLREIDVVLNQTKNENNDNYNEIPIILFLKKKNSIYGINNPIYLNSYKSKFPYFYSFNNINLKENIFLIGGIQNTLPLFDIMFILYEKDKNIIHIFSKIMKMISSILSSENNIEDAINSHFFQIFTLIIEKLSQFNENLLTETKYFFNSLLHNRNKSDSIYSSIKGLLYNKKVIQIILVKDNEFLEFLLSLSRNRSDVYYFLINLLVENYKNQNDCSEEFLKKIFEFFYNYLDNEKPEKIKDLFVFLEDKDMSPNLIEKTLKLIINLISYDIPEKYILEKLTSQKKEIVKSLFPLNKEKISEIKNKRLNKSEEKIKKIIDKKAKMFKYIAQNHLLNFCEYLPSRKEPSIKLLIIDLFQVIILYYISIFKDIDIEHLGEFTQNLERYKGKQYIFEYDSTKTNLIYEKLINLLPEKNNTNNNDINNENVNIILSKLFKDLIKLIQTTNKIDFHEFKNINFISYQDVIYNYIFEYLKLSRINHFSQYLNKENSLNFYDLYNNIKFLKALIPLFHHVYSLNQEIPDSKTQIIKELIENIIFDIYLDGIEKGPLSFLFLLDKLNNYTYKNNDDKYMKNFISFFFSLIANKTLFTLNGFDEIDIVEDFGKKFYNNETINIKEIYYNFISTFKNFKICNHFISNYNISCLDYIVLKKFILFFEIFSVNLDKFELNLKEYIILIIFCIMLCDKNFQILTRTNKECLFLRIVFLSVKSMLLRIYLEKDNNYILWVKSVTLIMSIFHFFFKNFQIVINTQIRNEDRNFKIIVNDFYNIFKNKDENILIENAKNYIFNKKEFLLNFFKNNNLDNSFQIEAFPYILTEIFLEQKEHKFKATSISETNMFKTYNTIKFYSRIKKNLFSWNNSYSDLYLFYNEEGKKKLKYKILNHYTEEMSLPFLVPILNINSYIPKNFNQNFNENFEGIDLIGKNLIEKDFNEIKVEILKNKKNTDNNNSIYDSLNLNQNNIKLGSDKDVLIYYFKIPESSFTTIETQIYSCCLIKQSLHIPGYIICKKEEFDFISFPRELKDNNNLFFDNEKKICYGSIFKNDKIYYLNIKLTDITFVYKKYYIFKDNSLEIFTKEFKSYFFEFNFEEELNKKKKVSELRESFFNYITNSTNSTINERYYYNGKLKALYNNKDSLLDNVKKKNLSKFEFLMRINLMSNRSFKDVNQYPIFPWIISDYSLISDNKKKKEIKSIKDFLNIDNLRNLSMPIAALNEKRLEIRKNEYNNLKKIFIQNNKTNIPLDYSKIDKLKEIKNYDLIPSFFNNHYLNSNQVYFYMNKIFPYSIPFFYFNQNLNSENLLIDLNKLYYFITEESLNQFSELIPELYYNPEIFRNINRINFGNLNLNHEYYQIIKRKYNIKENKLKINDVYLPYWSNNNPEKFICIMREILERPEIKLFDWVDLIFGFAQRGPEAFSKYNIYNYWCYENFINLEDISKDQRLLFINKSYTGVNPSQLFKKKITENQNINKNEKNEKNIISNNNFIINDLKKKLLDLINKLNLEKTSCEKILEEQNNPKNLKKKKEIESETDYEDLLNKVEKKIKYNNRILLKITNEKCEIKIFKQIAILYNFYEGDILIYNTKMIGNDFKLINIRNNLTKYNVNPNYLDKSEITSISLDKFFIFGTKLGTIFISKSGKERFEKIIHNNVKKIISICQNHILHIFISSSEDGYINIYTLPNCNLINSIFLPYFYANQILISFSPIPSFLLYNEGKKAFKSFSINGRNLLKYDKYISNVNNPKILIDENFIQFLKINNNNIVKFKMPFLDNIDNLNEKNNKKNNIVKKERKGNIRLIRKGKNKIR